MDEYKIYSGEDFAIAGELIFEEADTYQSIDDYEIYAGISTSLMGHTIQASTEDNTVVKINKRKGDLFFINIPAEQSSKLLPGILTISLMLINKQTGCKTVAEHKTFYLQDTRIA